MLWLLASTLLPHYFPDYFPPGANDPACNKIKLDILYGVGVLAIMLIIQIISILKWIKDWKFCGRHRDVYDELSGRRISLFYFLVAPGLWLLYAMWHLFNAEPVCKQGWNAVNYTNLLIMSFIAAPSVFGIVLLIIIGIIAGFLVVRDRIQNPPHPEGGLILN